MSVLKVEVEAKIPATPKVEQPIPVLINNIPIGGEKGQVLTKKSGKPYDVAWENPKGGEGGGEIVVEGVTEERVEEIVSEKTADLQPKTDESLETESKQVVGAINEVNSGLVKGINSSITEETNELVLELKGKDGTVLFSTKVQLPKSELPDLSAYVKNTDYISKNKAGIVAESSYYGFRSITDKGAVGGIKRTKEQYATDNGYYFISKGTLENIKYDYVMRSLSDDVDETSIWTDEDKAKACKTIGAVGEQDVANLPDNLTLTDEQKAKWRAWLGIE